MSFYTLSVIYFFIGSFGTHILSSQFEIHTVMASCLMGLMGVLVFYKNSYGFQIAKTMIFCGSFAGMSHNYFFMNWYDFFLISCIAGVIHYFVKNRFIGFGGKLGAIAFVSVFISRGLLWLI